MRCSDRAAAEFAARQALRAEQETVRLTYLERHHPLLVIEILDLVDQLRD